MTAPITDKPGVQLPARQHQLRRCEADNVLVLGWRVGADRASGLAKPAKPSAMATASSRPWMFWLHTPGKRLCLEVQQIMRAMSDVTA